MQHGDVNELVKAGGLLVVATWEAQEGKAETIAKIIGEFLPQAQREPGVKLFLIGRGKENANQFLFYELFADESAFAAHQATEPFKRLIVGQAVPLLASRTRSQYTLLG